MRQSPVAASSPLPPGKSCRSRISSPAAAGALLPAVADRPSLQHAITQNLNAGPNITVALLRAHHGSKHAVGDEADVAGPVPCHC